MNAEILLYSGRQCMRLARRLVWWKRILYRTVYLIRRTPMHCVIIVGQRAYDANLTAGYRILPASDLVRSTAAFRMAFEISRAHLSDAEWRALRVTPVRAFLDALAFPRIWAIHSCASDAARLIGSERLCRVPIDLIAAVTEGEYDGQRRRLLSRHLLPPHPCGHRATSDRGG